MSALASNATLADLAMRVAGAKSILITTHVKPDGDAMGSCLALARAVESRGIAARIFLAGPVEPALMQLAGATPIAMIEQGLPAQEPDLILILDTAAKSQLEPVLDWLRPRRDRAIVIDHHPQGDDIASMRLVDTTAAATTQLVAALLDELGINIVNGAGSIAEALFAGLATDTGWFRFSNADARAFELAASLLRAGVDKSRLYSMIEERRRPERLALLARALASIEYHRGGMISIMSLGQEDFAQCGGGVIDLAGLVSEPLSVATVRASALLVQTEPGRTKVSVRSKPGTDGAIDANAIARRLGGGGHVQAAGAKLSMNLDQTKAALLAAIEHTLGAH